MGASGTSKSSVLDKKSQDDASLPSVSAAVAPGEPGDCHSLLDSDREKASQGNLDQDSAKKFEPTCTSGEPITSDTEQVEAGSDALAGELWVVESQTKLAIFGTP